MPTKIALSLIISCFCFIVPFTSTISQNSVHQENTSNGKIKQSDENSTEFNAIQLDKKIDKKEMVYIRPSFFYGLLIDLLFVAAIILFIYYPIYKKNDTIFTFVLFNITVYLLIYFLNGIKLSTGAAFGLFAVFSMLRYRTEGISMRDMTYLFAFIAMALISGIQLPIRDLLISNAIIFILIYLFDSGRILKRQFSKGITISEVELTHTDKKEELLNLLKEMTGLNIDKAITQKINYKNQTADIKIYYHD